MSTNPTIITPEITGNASKEALLAYTQANFSKITEQLKTSGSVLFRGFQVNTPTDFEQVALSMDSDLKDDYLGTSPRNIVKGTKFAFSASELPPHYPIMQHCEMSFLPSAPRRLFFFCHIEPQIGGETPVCDFRNIYKKMDPAIRKDFETKGIRVIRNYGGPGQESKGAFQLKPWEDMFQTTDKSIVERKCRENNIKVEWQPNDGLRLISEQPAFKKHPETGEMVWFNHLQVFHAAGAAIEYRKIARRQKTFDAWKVNIMLTLMTWVKLVKERPEERAMHVCYADGTEIPMKYIQHVQDLIWEEMYFLKWQKGDVIMIDNFSTAHGRMPYKGPREILVSWTS
jgi:alpha-ketoglutarate-dependent taurine dioxygenase